MDITRGETSFLDLLILCFLMSPLWLLQTIYVKDDNGYVLVCCYHTPVLPSSFTTHHMIWFLVRFLSWVWWQQPLVRCEQFLFVSFLLGIVLIVLLGIVLIVLLGIALIVLLGIALIVLLGIVLIVLLGIVLIVLLGIALIVLLGITLIVLLWFVASDNSFGIFKLFWYTPNEPHWLNWNCWPSLFKLSFQWWTTISPMSTKETITSDLKSLDIKKDHDIWRRKSKSWF